MPDLPHLILPRAEYEQPRRKTGFGRPPGKNFRTHGRRLKRELNQVFTTFRRRRRPHGIRPDLILRIQLDPKAQVDEQTWERCGLNLLSVDENKTLVLFSSDHELLGFKSRLDQYRKGPAREDQRSAPHTKIFASIAHIGEVLPEDRIGPVFRAEGIRRVTDLRASDVYTVDVELWDLGSQQLCRERVHEIRTYLESTGGRVTDDYVGENLVLMRTKCGGQTVRGLLRIDSIALVDLPPKPRVTLGQLLEMSVGDFPDVAPPDEKAPSIGVLDSGVAAAHPLLAPAVGEATTSPRSWGDGSDGHGHGTMVCGLALYGDIQRCIREGSFAPGLKLFSARVLNSRCEFDDERLITSQMRDAIHYFTETYGCRVFNISLGDPRVPYRGGKVSPWAAILDTLARELDVVIVVSAGNYNHRPGQQSPPTSHVRDYPAYLLGDEARIIEPATGAIVLTVGALSHTAGISQQPASQRVALRPIALQDQPSPFTRSGPGLGKAVKPELVEYGGNIAYDAALGHTTYDPPLADLSIVSLNRDYSMRLFTADIGTSFAAPRVAHAAAKLLQTFPEASANLVRALLASSASVPVASSLAVGSLGDDAIARICGYGQPTYIELGCPTGTEWFCMRKPRLGSTTSTFTKSR